MRQEMADAKAVTKYIRVQPLKAREVINMIRGREAENALGILQFCNRKAARIIEKTLRSAIANAENNQNMNPASLFVKEARVDGGPILKPLRSKSRARGSQDAIRKRTSMITIVLSERPVVDGRLEN